MEDQRQASPQTWRLKRVQHVPSAITALVPVQHLCHARQALTMLSLDRLPWRPASLAQALDIVRVQEQQLTLARAPQATIAQVARKSPLQLHMCVRLAACVLLALHCQPLAPEPVNTKTRSDQPFARAVCLDTIARRPPSKSASPNLE